MALVVLLGYELNAVTALVPPLLTTLGLSYAVHVVSETEQERAAAGGGGAGPVAAALFLSTPLVTWELRSAYVDLAVCFYLLMAFGLLAAAPLERALPRGAAAGRARTSHRSWQPTVSVGGVRAYVPGDPRHHIHWRTTARRDQLHAVEFDQEMGGDIWLVLDLDRDVQAGRGERSTEEMGVVVAASVAALLLDAGRAVGLVAHGHERRTVMPARGQGHLWGLLAGLAQVRATGAYPLPRVLEEVSRALPVGATALVITPSSDPVWLSGLARLRGRGIGVAAVLLDAASFEQEVGEGRLSPRVERLRELLADARVEAEVIDADTPLSLRPPTGQVRRWEFKVLGTGRAVAVSTPWGV